MRYSVSKIFRRLPVLLWAAVLALAASTALAADPARLAKGDTFILAADAFNVGRNETVRVTNRFAVISSAGDRITFRVKTYGGSLASCSLTGEALWQGSCYEFTDQGPGYSCTLLIHSSRDEVRLEDRDMQCRKQYCGASARLDGFVFKRESGHGKTGSKNKAEH